MFEEIKPLVNENIKKALAAGDLNAKVMPGDHIVTPEERENIVFKYDILKKKLKSKFKMFFANIVVNKMTKDLGKNIMFDGLENALVLKGESFIITANHYSPYDSLIIRHLTNKLGYKNKLSIVVNESNLFMKEAVGKLLRNVDVMPYTQDVNYLGKTFFPALDVKKEKGYVVLVYPEQEMWLDYQEARTLKTGAYHFATKLNVPILPTFTTFKDREDGVREYTLHIGKPLYSDQSKSSRENKETLKALDFAFKSQKFH